jgi:hypothetical protein
LHSLFFLWISFGFQKFNKEIAKRNSGIRKLGITFANKVGLKKHKRALK